MASGLRRFCRGVAANGALWALAVLVGCWSLYHLLEYVGAAALWSWMRDGS